MKLFTIFGNPVAHSISPMLHNSAIKELGLDACYIRYALENGEKIADKFNSLKLSGANVTVPHKEWAYQKCDEVRGLAKDIKAVNTLVKKEGKIVGYNTDAPGFYKSIENFKNLEKVLILGAGGTTKAISYILREEGKEVTILNRSEKRLEFYKKEGFRVFSWNGFKVEDYDLIVNATSAGLKDDNLPLQKEMLSSLMKKAKYAFDVIYGKDTPFLKLANENSLTCKDGRDMLLNQAVLAFSLFYDEKISLKSIEESMRKVF